MKQELKEKLVKGYVCVLFIYLLVMCCTFFLLGFEISTLDDPRTDYIRQITWDWAAVPFVDISVTDAWTCEDESTQVEVFSRPWYGTVMACDCLDSCVSDEVIGTWCYEMILDYACTDA